MNSQLLLDVLLWVLGLVIAVSWAFGDIRFEYAAMAMLWLILTFSATSNVGHDAPDSERIESFDELEDAMEAEQ